MQLCILRRPFKKFWYWLLSTIRLWGKMLLALAVVLYWCSLKCCLLVYFARFNILKKAGWRLWLILMKSAIMQLQNFWYWRTFSHSATASTQPYGCCLQWICEIICHCQLLGSWVSLRQKKPWRWAPVSMSLWGCLRIKLSCCWKYCSAKSCSQWSAMDISTSSIKTI